MPQTQIALLACAYFWETGSLGQQLLDHREPSSPVWEKLSGNSSVAFSPSEFHLDIGCKVRPRSVRSSSNSKEVFMKIFCFLPRNFSCLVRQHIQFEPLRKSMIILVGEKFAQFWGKELAQLKLSPCDAQVHRCHNSHHTCHRSPETHRVRQNCATEFSKNDLVILDSLKPEARPVPHPYPASVGSHPKPCPCQVDWKLPLRAVRCAVAVPRFTVGDHLDKWAPIQFSIHLQF